MTRNKKRFHYAGLLTLLLVSAFFLGGRLIYLYLADATRFPVNTVKVTATYQHISHQQLEAILSDYLSNSFFFLPVGRLHTELSELDWISRVRVERVWPDSLKIVLIEKKPVAIWNNALLTKDGDVFNEGGAVEDFFLPKLRGPANQQHEVLQVYKKMSKILSMYGLHAASLEWRDNHAWELTLANGVQVRLGKRDLELRITRFCKAYPAVFADKSEQLASVDLRYPRGMAVQWKK
ncbi:cell division protein FtsQ/DivIB [Legionella spiritensis]|uniref:Cell division protein FtsQ n=1 Tax=Legionella spiritensis TaxID=452 RepID=A0A0W0Z692_LEGSP|nr:cell division protein FtsQ/DivIB [Legionella spiritensis]KTD64637.1 cell division protein FtsQ [Legionella spiritensis]SNV47542.1 cell division protein FtsQ [Legionella spiritensis]VEG91317.1 cell division protein FtsQ [Legionella spiritensis]